MRKKRATITNLHSGSWVVQLFRFPVVDWQATPTKLAPGFHTWLLSAKCRSKPLLHHLLGWSNASPCQQCQAYGSAMKTRSTKSVGNWYGKRGPLDQRRQNAVEPFSSAHVAYEWVESKLTCMVKTGWGYTSDMPQKSLPGDSWESRTRKSTKDSAGSGSQQGSTSSDGGTRSRATVLCPPHSVCRGWTPKGTI